MNDNEHKTGEAPATCAGVFRRGLELPLCLFMALNGHPVWPDRCSLSGVKRTFNPTASRPLLTQLRHRLPD